MVRLHELWKNLRQALRRQYLMVALYAACAVVALVDPRSEAGDRLPVPAQQAVVNIWIQIGLLVVSYLISYALRPDPVTPEPRKASIPIVEDGKPIQVIFGDVWIPDSWVQGFKQLRAIPIKADSK